MSSPVAWLVKKAAMHDGVGPRHCCFLHQDRKSTRLNSSHRCRSYAVFCVKKKNSSLEFPPAEVPLICHMNRDSKNLSTHPLCSFSPFSQGPHFSGIFQHRQYQAFPKADIC